VREESIYGHPNMACLSFVIDHVKLTSVGEQQ